MDIEQPVTTPPSQTELVPSHYPPTFSGLGPPVELPGLGRERAREASERGKIFDDITPRSDMSVDRLETRS